MCYIIYVKFHVKAYFRVRSFSHFPVIFPQNIARKKVETTNSNDERSIKKLKRKT
jgi:hypothetical protein